MKRLAIGIMAFLFIVSGAFAQLPFSDDFQDNLDDWELINGQGNEIAIVEDPVNGSPNNVVQVYGTTPANGGYGDQCSIRYSFDLTDTIYMNVWVCPQYLGSYDSPGSHGPGTGPRVMLQQLGIGHIDVGLDPNGRPRYFTTDDSFNYSMYLTNDSNVVLQVMHWYEYEFTLTSDDFLVTIYDENGNVLVDYSCVAMGHPLPSWDTFDTAQLINYFPSSNGYSYFDDFHISSPEEFPPVALPFAETFENNLDYWVQAGDPGNDAEIAMDPDGGDNHVMRAYADNNIPPYLENSSYLKTWFEPTEGIHFTSRFYMEQFGMGDDPNSWGAGTAADAWFETEDELARMRINVGEDGCVRYIRTGLNIPPHDYGNWISDYELSLNTWYTYDITYRDSELKIMILDEFNVPVIDFHNPDIGFDITIAKVRIGSFCLAAPGYSYFDDVNIDVEPETPLLVINASANNDPLVIPSQGGSFGFSVEKTSHYGTIIIRDAWMQIRHLATNNTVEVFHRNNLSLFTGTQIYNLNQSVPGYAPAGQYEFSVFVGDYAWQPEAFDSFAFSKAGSGPMTGSMGSASDWTLTGTFGDSADAPIASLPSSYQLAQPYPNPFNPSTTISVSLPEAADLTITVYNTAGQQVAELENGQHSAGEHTLTFDASSLASGLYFIRATVPGQMDQVQKVMLVQ